MMLLPSISRESRRDSDMRLKARREVHELARPGMHPELVDPRPVRDVMRRPFSAAQTDRMRPNGVAPVIAHLVRDGQQIR